MNAAERGNTIVAAHSVSLSGTQDVARWYSINVSSGPCGAAARVDKAMAKTKTAMLRNFLTTRAI